MLPYNYIEDDNKEEICNTLSIGIVEALQISSLSPSDFVLRFMVLVDSSHLTPEHDSDTDLIIFQDDMSTADLIV